MKTKIFLSLAIAGLSFAGTKSYDVTFDAPAVLGPMEVESGHYKVSFEGSKVTLVNENTRKAFETTATVQTSEKKFSSVAPKPLWISSTDAHRPYLRTGFITPSVSAGNLDLVSLSRTPGLLGN
jgi:hypothetical protein